MDFSSNIKKYTEELGAVIENIDISEINALLNYLIESRDKEKQIFIFGNGGSGSTASHFAADLNKGTRYASDKRLKIICLNDNIPIILAYANDEGYESVFVEQLKNFVNQGDLVIGISGSGNSKNVIKAIEYANSIGAKTVGICGYDGGKLKQIAKSSVHANINDMQKVEDIHIIITHILMQAISDKNKR